MRDRKLSGSDESRDRHPNGPANKHWVAPDLSRSVWRRRRHASKEDHEHHEGEHGRYADLFGDSCIKSCKSCCKDGSDESDAETNRH